jgi:hypothetical protein
MAALKVHCSSVVCSVPYCDYNKQIFASGKHIFFDDRNHLTQTIRALALNHPKVGSAQMGHSG